MKRVARVVCFAAAVSGLLAVVQVYGEEGGAVEAAAIAEPFIEEVGIDRGIDVNSWDWVTYHQNLSGVVRTSEPATVACIVINDTRGWQYAISSCAEDGWPDWEGWQEELYGTLGFWIVEEADQTVRFRLHQEDQLTPPPAGTYTIKVVFFDGTPELTYTTPAVPAIAEAHPTLLGPTADSVIEDTTPTFQWMDAPAGATNTVLVREEGSTYYSGEPADDGGRIWAVDPGSASQVEYNFDGTATREALLPGHAYGWQLDSWTLEWESGVNPRVSAWTSQVARSRFALDDDWPALPELPGKLAYTSVLWGDWSWDADSEVLWGYSATLQDRAWLAPDAAARPQWWSDGSKLLFYKKDLGLWIDSLDGSMPFHLPIDAWGYPALSPDDTQVAYCLGSYGWYDIWVANVDGTDPHKILGFEGADLRDPAWSPSGTWIAFRRAPAEVVGQDTWLVHPDGSDPHPLVATGVRDYPGYEVDGIFDAAWAPSGTALAVSFGAKSADGENETWGIGTISVNGGLIKPVFIAPSTHMCCAAPQTPCWSPDGTQIVFSSAHQLAPDPEWANGKFEPGAELWLIDAAGNSEETRLTYNYSREYGIDWWAEPTLTDVGPGFWALCEVNRCVQAGIVGGCEDGAYHGDWAVNRGQMPVFVSRALAGGEENVPDPAADPGFTDVDETDWAYRYICYAVDQNVVQGYPEGDYRPEEVVTRDQMAVYIARAMVAPTGEAALAGYAPADPRDFPDAADTFWAYKHIEYSVEKGVVQGYDDGYYHPEVVVTRDQMAVYVARAFGLVG